MAACGTPMNQKKPRILIVEDDKFLSSIYERRFLLDGFAVHLVGNGLQVVDAALAETPDCILLDILLPGLDGLSVLKLLKGQPETRRIPVLLITNLGHNKDEQKRGLDLGADGFLIKAHYRPSEVVQEVRTILGLELV